MRAKRVYFLRPVGQLGPVKIGCSVFPEGRLDAFTLWSPQPLELVTSVPGTHADEKALHGMFRKHHVHGEWFGASKQLLELVNYCIANGQLPELPRVVKFPTKIRRQHSASRPPKPDKRAWAARMRAEYENGVTIHDLAEKHGVCVATAKRMILFAGGSTRPRGNPNRGLRDMDRAAEIAKRRLAGETLQAIGHDYGLTRERVRQILKKMGFESRPCTRAA